MLAYLTLFCVCYRDDRFLINITLLFVLTMSYHLTRLRALLPPPVQCNDMQFVCHCQCSVGIIVSNHATDGAVAITVVHDGLLFKPKTL